MNEQKEAALRKFLYALATNPWVEWGVRTEARIALKDWDDADKKKTDGQAKTTGKATS